MKRNAKYFTCKLNSIWSYYQYFFYYLNKCWVFDFFIKWDSVEQTLRKLVGWNYHIRVFFYPAFIWLFSLSKVYIAYICSLCCRQWNAYIHCLKGYLMRNILSIPIVPSSGSTIFGAENCENMHGVFELSSYTQNHKAPNFTNVEGRSLRREGWHRFSLKMDTPPCTWRC